MTPDHPQPPRAGGNVAILSATLFMPLVIAVGFWCQAAWAPAPSDPASLGLRGSFDDAAILEAPESTSAR